MSQSTTAAKPRRARSSATTTRPSSGPGSAGGSSLGNAATGQLLSDDEDDQPWDALGWSREKYEQVRDALATLAAASKSEAKAFAKAVERGASAANDWVDTHGTGTHRAGGARGAWGKKSFGSDDVDGLDTTGARGGGRIGGGAGAYAGGRAGKVDLGPMGSAWEVLGEAGLVVGGELVLSGKARKEFEHVALEVRGKFAGFVGLRAKARGRAGVTKSPSGIPGVHAEGSAGAFAGGEATGEGDVAVDFTDTQLGLEAGLEGRAAAGAEANAEGEFVVNPRSGEVSLMGSAGVMAGVTVKGKVKGAAKLYGRRAAGFAIEGSATAGAEGSVSGGFSLRRGRLRLLLGAKAALGLGGGAEGDVDVDFKPIAVWVKRNTYRMREKSSTASSRSSSLDPPGTTPPATGNADLNPATAQKLEDHLRRYAEEKEQKLAADRADNYVKIEKVQAYVDELIPRHHLKADKDERYDAALTDVVRRALTPRTTGVGIRVKIRYGHVDELELTPSETRAVQMIRSGGHADLFDSGGRGAAVDNHGSSSGSTTDLREVGS